MGRKFWKPGRIAALSLVLLLALGGFIVSGTLLSVKEIKVVETFAEGAGAYGEPTDFAAKVKALSGVKEGQAMLLISQAAVKKGVESDPMFKFASMRLEFPSTVVVEFLRRVPAAYVPRANGCLLIDKDGLVIMLSTSVPLDTPMIADVTVADVYTATNTDVKSVPALEAIGRALEIIEEIKKQNVSFMISELNCNDLDNMYLITQDGLTVILGNQRDMGAKVELLAAAMPHLPKTDGFQGTLDVTALNKADYINPAAVQTFSQN